MTVRLAPRKVQDIKMLAISILNTKNITIREFAKIIGKMVAAEPGVKYAALHYKSMELERDQALKKSYGDFDKLMCISYETTQCLKWWINNIESSFKPISLGLLDRRIETDSSLIGYGGHDVTNNQDFSGLWNERDKVCHINYLELKAAFLCLQNFCNNVNNEHIYLFLDNTVAIKYLSKMGGRKPQLNQLAKDIWLWCEHRNIWLSVFHIPGKFNKRADKLSRLGKKLNDDMEWGLKQDIFTAIIGRMGFCDIDLFATRKNCKLEKYVSYLPDKRSCAVNAFSISWKQYTNDAFPPFSIIGRVIQKLCEDLAEMILVAPIFPSQPWFPQMLKQVSGPCFVLPKTNNILYLPGTENKHRLTTMRLGAFRLSGNALSVQDYQKTLQTSSCSHGDLPQENNMGLITKDGCTFCSERQIDKINPSVGNVVAFLTDLYDEGLSYSAINTAKSMLSSVFEIIHKRDIGKEVLIRRFMKGIFHLRPVIPKTIFTWDVKVVLKFLSSLEDNKLTLRMISVKLALLLVLTTGQRCQTIHAILLKNMEFGKNDIKIRIGDLLKQTKPNNHLAELYLEEYKLNDKICVVKVLKSYLQRRKDLRKSSNLFITSQKPHAAASKSTIASWIKLGLRLAGIDLNLYTPHSTRSASTSALVSKIPIDTIIKTAVWTNNCTFRKFYNRPVSNDSCFSTNLLAKHS